MKSRELISTFLLMILVGCSSQPSGELVTVDVTESFPKKDLILQDVFDVEYVPLETTDEFVCGGVVMAVGSKYIAVRNQGSDGNLYIFDRSGKGISVINRKGNGGQEYTSMSGGVLLDEENDEIFINSLAQKKVFVYDFQGNFKRTLNFMKDARYYRMINYDKEHILCWNQIFEYNLKAKEAPCFFLISKLDGSVQGIEIPIEKRTTTVMSSYDEKTKLTYSWVDTPNSIQKYKDQVTLFDPSADTLYWLTKENELVPYMVRTPSIHSMDVERFLYPELLTEQYHFMKIYTKDNDVDDVDLVYDKEEKMMYNYQMANRDFVNPRDEHIRGETINEELAGYEILYADFLYEAYADNNIKEGKLKEIASRLKEDDNVVIMLLKHKK